MTTLNGNSTLLLNAKGKANKAALFDQVISTFTRERGKAKREEVIDRVKRLMNYYPVSQRWEVTAQDFYAAVSRHRKKTGAKKVENKPAAAKPTPAPTVATPTPKLPPDLSTSLDLAYRLLQSCGGNLEMASRILQAAVILNG